MNYEEIVLDAFRKINARAGHVVPIRNFRNGIMRQMNPVEQEEFIAVINAMITDGLVTYEGANTGLEVIRLTEKGFSQLYHSMADYQIADALMQMFARSKYKVGEIIPMRNINMQFIPSLNPVEQDRFEQVANTLKKQGIVADYEEVLKYCLYRGLSFDAARVVAKAFSQKSLLKMRGNPNFGLYWNNINNPKWEQNP